MLVVYLYLFKVIDICFVPAIELYSGPRDLFDYVSQYFAVIQSMEVGRQICVFSELSRLQSALLYTCHVPFF